MANVNNSKYDSKPHKCTVEECQDMKDKGNECMELGRYEDAIVNYTFAMENFPPNELYVLYSNRSQALLKLEQYYFALQDAEKTIELAPAWAKGYFRKGEVQFHAGFYSDAIKSYNQARVRDASDKSIADCVKKATRQMAKTAKDTARRPLVFTMTSLLIGLILVVAEHFTTQIPILQYILLKLVVLVLFCGGGYLTSRLYQYTLDQRANILLEEPPDVFGTKAKHEKRSSGEDNLGGSNSQKGSKSQGSRHRHRRGRS